MTQLFFNAVLAISIPLIFSYTWKVQPLTSTAVVIGVGTGGKDICVGAATGNGVGGFVEVFHNGTWAKFQLSNAALMADSAISLTGLSVATGMSKVFISHDFGQTYELTNGISGLAQAAYITDDDTIRLVGGWYVEGEHKLPTTVYSVVSSTDKGETWTFSSPVPDMYLRYGAFPTKDTWYVSSGYWGNNPPAPGRFKMFSKLEIDVSTGQSHIVEGNFSLGAGTDYTGWFGSVSKTTDGGKSWEQVLTTDFEKEYLYFNGIACSSADHCTVVGDGDNPAGGYMTVAHTTFDGGKTWDRVLTGTEVSMVQVKYIDDLDGWIVATKKDGRDLSAQFYHTTDGGKTFAVEETLGNCFALDLDFELLDKTAIASCSSSSGNAGYIALYR